MIPKAKISRTWLEACNLADSWIQGYYDTLSIGETFDTEVGFEYATSLLQVDDNFDPIVAAALTIMLANKLELGKALPVYSEYEIWLTRKT